MLPLAAEALGTVPYPCRFVEGDLLAWAEAKPDGPDGPEPPPADLILSSFAVHHLQAEGKRRFLRGCRRRIAPGGPAALGRCVPRPGGEP